MHVPDAKPSFVKAKAQPALWRGFRLRAVPLRLEGRARTGRVFERVHGIEPWKRTVDVALGAAAVILAAPIVGIAAVLVKLTSKGPVFIAQERIGLNRRTGDRRRKGGAPPTLERRRNSDRRVADTYGKPFNMYKFRSMKNEAEPSGAVWATEDDPRITAVGRVLRKTRIDEIPQFLNVLSGDMSVVGPRPERGHFYRELTREIPDFPKRLRAKPGITGLAQVNNGYTNTIAGTRIKLNHDLAYIRDLRPATDAKILLRTISVVLTGKGAC